MSWLLLFASSALAGSGPWTVTPGDHNVYVGAGYGSFETISDGEGGSVSLGTPIRGLQVVGVYTAGLVHGLDVEILLPYERSWADHPAYPVCVDGRPADYCTMTQGLGDAGAQLRLRLLDEGAYRPLTLSTRLMARSGAAYANSRSRLTTLGDGQTDIGLGLAVGRTGAAETGQWYRVSAASSYWYRFGVGKIDGKKVPADEISFGLDALGSPVSWVGAGVSLTGFTRLGGVSLRNADFGEENTWVSLAAVQVRAGPQLAFYTDNDWTFFSSVMFTVGSKSSPRDLHSVSLGVGRYIRARDRSGGDD